MTPPTIEESDEYIYTDDPVAAIRHFEPATHVSFKFLEDDIYGRGIDDVLSLIDELGIAATFGAWHFHRDIVGIAVRLPAEDEAIRRLLSLGVVYRWDLLQEGKVLVTCDDGGEFIIWKRPKDMQALESRAMAVAPDEAFKALASALAARFGGDVTGRAELSPEMRAAYGRLRARMK